MALITYTNNTKIRWPFKVLLSLILAAFIFIAYSVMSSTYELAAHGTSGRAIVMQTYVAASNKPAQVAVIVSPSTSQGRSFEQINNLIPTYYSVGQEVPVVFSDHGQYINGTIGTKQTLILKLILACLFVTVIATALIIGIKKQTKKQV